MLADAAFGILHPANDRPSADSGDAQAKSSNSMALSESTGFTTSLKIRW
jgi:hypothetical protein